MRLFDEFCFGDMSKYSYRKKLSDMSSRFLVSPGGGTVKIVGSGHESSTHKPYYIVYSAVFEMKSRQVYHESQEVIFGDNHMIILFIYEVVPSTEEFFVLLCQPAFLPDKPKLVSAKLECVNTVSTGSYCSSVILMDVVPTVVDQKPNPEIKLFLDSCHKVPLIDLTVSVPEKRTNQGKTSNGKINYFCLKQYY